MTLQKHTLSGDLWHDSNSCVITKTPSIGQIPPVLKQLHSGFQSNIALTTRICYSLSRPPPHLLTPPYIYTQNPGLRSLSTIQLTVPLCSYGHHRPQIIELHSDSLRHLMRSFDSLQTFLFIVGQCLYFIVFLFYHVTLLYYYHYFPVVCILPVL